MNMLPKYEGSCFCTQTQDSNMMVSVNLFCKNGQQAGLRCNGLVGTNEQQSQNLTFYAQPSPSIQFQSITELVKLFLTPPLQLSRDRVRLPLKINLIKEVENFATNILPPGFLIFHDTSTSS